ncbi:hypothetical protein LCGC14_1299380 [marine sediment metagenome]|uniref:Pyridoxamine 5'-phosphate oxidase putative domain-containing protein n=1 Tax=marine sediment metagenome TaxID=412755 RepID=A0A0F9NT04_9ZZZZ
MRRIEKSITDKKIITELLNKGRYITIAMSKDDYPYIITLSYGYDNSRDALYFHCAKEGQKIDYIKYNSQVCGTIIEDNGYYNDECVQAFRSLVIRGKLSFIDTIQEKKHAFDVLLNHLEKDPKIMKEKHFGNDKNYIKTGILRLDITEITGKEEKAS